MQLPGKKQFAPILNWPAGFIAQWGKTIAMHNCRAEAAALTFFTLLALVPLIVLLAKLITIIPSAIADIDQARQAMFDLLVPDSAAAIETYLDKFAQRANTITLAGVPVLMASIIGLMSQLGRILTKIFAMPPRKIWLRLPFAIFSLIFGPIVLSLLFSAAAWARHVSILGWVPWNLGADLIGLLAQVIAASLFFVLIPTQRLALRLVLLGGLLLVLGQNVLRAGFTKALGSLANYEVLYGVFAVIPLFLLWVYACWMLLLIIASLLQTMRSFERPNQPPEL